MTAFEGSKSIKGQTMSVHSGLRRARIRIDEAALKHNFSRVKDFAPHAQVMAVIKANAYGHGLLYAAQTFAQVMSNGDSLAVAMPDEAFTLRDNGLTLPIVVLHGVATRQEFLQCAALAVEPVINQMWQIDLLESVPADVFSSPLKIWLKVDTGMHRLGILPTQVAQAITRLQACQPHAVVALMSHFANADDVEHSLNKKQLAKFCELESSDEMARSMANSAAIISRADSHFETVRPGIMLYGSSPFRDKTASELDLKAVMNFESQLIAMSPLKAGDAIGYGSSWVCPEDMTVGVVAAGYGDGYPRHAKSSTPVWLNGKRCGLLGRVSMDSICIDLRGVDARVGDRVVLWGKELPVDEVAAGADTISYEILCAAGGLAA